MNNVKGRAANRWRDILSNFMEPRLLDGRHHPCPICGGKDRFRFDDLDGKGSYYCSGPECGPGSGIHLLAMTHSISHSEAWKMVEEVVGSAKIAAQAPAIDRIARIKRVLSSAKPATENGDVSTYLHHRGLSISVPESIMEEKCRNGDTMMVGKFAHGNKIRGLHITFLRNGKKIDGDGAKKMWGTEKGSLKGSAIRLSALGSGSSLMIAEGIETALACMEMMPGIPTWATGSAGLMEDIEIPAQVKTVIICGDNDSSFTGQAAAYGLAKRLRAQKKEVIVRIPRGEDSDWLDQLVLDKTANG